MAIKESRAPRIVAISGAKGGVGKTIFATNLAVYLATLGRRIVVADADACCANIHTCLGLGRLSYSWGGTPTVLDPRKASFSDLSQRITDTPFQGLRYLDLAYDELFRRSAAHPDAVQKRSSARQLVRELRELDADYVVLDLGSGKSRRILDAFSLADQAIFLTQPEPCSMEATYRFLRHAFARRLLREMPDVSARGRLMERLRSTKTTPEPLSLVRHLCETNDPAAGIAARAMRDFRFYFVINQTRVRGDLELGDAVCRAARWKLGLRLHYVGHIDDDDAVWACMRQKRPVMVESPGTKASKNIERIARRLLTLEANKPSSFPEDGRLDRRHHDLLEVTRGASDEEIRRAHKRAREVYDKDALCCYGLFSTDELATLQVQLEEAYDVLMDPERRRPYELSVFPSEKQAELPPSDGLSAEPLPPMPSIMPDTDFSGGLLRAVREARGIKLADVSQATKIGLGYLKAIEEDDYAALPATVYVRGFVSEFAKYLKLDALQASRTYIRRFQSARERTAHVRNAEPESRTAGPKP